MSCGSRGRASGDEQQNEDADEPMEFQYSQGRPHKSLRPVRSVCSCLAEARAQFVFDALNCHFDSTAFTERNLAREHIARACVILLIGG